MSRARGAVAMAWAALLVLVCMAATASPAAAAQEAIRIPGGPYSATDSTPVELDAEIYLPEALPAPAIVLAHGFGGSKDSVGQEAQVFRDRGFVVLAYSARGFGNSTGLISMNAPEFEVADASRLIDYLATRPEVSQEADGDPIVGFAGGSYGGALALMIAGYDARVDAIAADITWNDLQTSLFGQSVFADSNVGVFKELWAGWFFSAGLVNSSGEVTACGRFSPAWCEAYSAAASKGVLTSEAKTLMQQSSPASITDRITVPTLLGGGQADSLFPLAQVNANAEQIAASHPEVPVKVVWHAGGHDGGVNETDRLRELTGDWFAEHLAQGAAVSNDFEVSVTQSSAISDRDAAKVEVFTAQSYPGIFGADTVSAALQGDAQRILAPAGGVPAAVSSLPGAGGLAGLASGLLSLPFPNQTATFTSVPLDSSLRIVGSPRVRLRVSTETEQRDVTLFASLRTIGPTGQALLPQGLVAPIRLDRVGPEGVEVDVALPTIVTNVAAGERLAVVVGTTDQTYRLPPGPAIYTVGLASADVQLPTVAMVQTSSGAPAWLWPFIGVGVVLLVILVVVLLRPRRGALSVSTERTDVPIAAVGLTKQFRGGVTAVADASFEVRRGTVTGLLGPNGAGKTTTMRMVMGLITPSAGAAYVFGTQTAAGSPALAHIGAFIEGPGFLPHLSGRKNLELYWRASGRRGVDPRFEEVLEISGLGVAIDRKVRTYSQGMRQRLAIAQAMLGMPDVLLLDEPTNGLDPPQIREMREVLRAYATEGRTVIISSHLLSEVEQVCSDVVVMHHGTVIAHGSVAELLAGRTGMRLEDVFMEIVGEGHEVVSS